MTNEPVLPSNAVDPDQELLVTHPDWPVAAQTTHRRVGETIEAVRGMAEDDRRNVRASVESAIAETVRRLDAGEDVGEAAFGDLMDDVILLAAFDHVEKGAPIQVMKTDALAAQAE